MTLDNIHILVRHKETGLKSNVLLIDFVNRVVDVLPDDELEGGNQIEWSFDDIEMFIKL